MQATQETERLRRQRNSPQTQFKALGSGGEEDQEAWEQWFGYVDWILNDRPDDLEFSRVPDEEDFDEEGNPLPEEADE